MLQTEVTDAELVRALAEGDDGGRAFAELHTRHVDAVRAVCTNQLRATPDSVEDLVQETFLRLLAHAATIRQPDKVVRWLRRTARFACHDHRERAHHRREAPGPLPAEAAESLDFTDLLAEADRVDRLLQRMDRRHATVLRAHYLHGHDVAEIAHGLGMNAGAVRTALYRARQEGRRLLDSGRALLPVPVVEWLGRVADVVRTTGSLPGLMAAAVPIIAATVLVPTIGGDGPARFPVAPSQAEVTGAAAEAVDAAGAGALPQVPAADGEDTPPGDPGTAVDHGPGTGHADGAAAGGPVPQPMHDEVHVPVANARLTPGDPNTPNETEVIIEHEATGEVFALGEGGEDPDPLFEALCTVADASAADPVRCAHPGG